MGFLEIMLSVPLGVVLYIFTHQVVTLLNVDLPYGDKYQRSLIMAFIMGILVLVLGNTLFKNNKTIKNKTMQYGLTLCGILLIGYSTFSNWGSMDSGTKLIIFSIILSGFIWYIYKLNKKDKKKKKPEDIIEEIIEDEELP